MLTLIYSWSCSHEGARPEGLLFALAFICDVVIILSFIVAIVEGVGA